MCGIFGIISPSPRKFDVRTFAVLGVNNDSRGGDSCGVFIDKKYEYGVNEFKLFYNFFPNSKVLSSTTKCQIALGHCRKASVGAVNAANAQPVVIKEGNEVKYVLMHNGTIVNYNELAKKYIPTINTSEMTDSQVMAHIFYHTGYAVLGEYIGAGAFVMVDYRTEKPRVLFFKGESKQNQYSPNAQIERPLFCTYSSTEFIFSSIMDYLKALRPNREVLTLQPNRLIELKDGELSVIQEYNRTNLWQTRTSVYTRQYNYSSYNSSNKGYQKSYFPTNYWDEVIEMDQDGIYLNGTTRAHGLLNVDVLGNIENRKGKGVMQAAFWKGVLLKNASCYNFLNKFASDMRVTPGELLDLLPDLVHYLSPCACWKDNKGIWVTSSSPTSSIPYTGTAVFPFTSEEISFNNGSLENYSEGVPYKESILDLESCKDYKININEIYELMY